MEELAIYILPDEKMKRPCVRTEIILNVEAISSKSWLLTSSFQTQLVTNHSKEAKIKCNCTPAVQKSAQKIQSHEC